MNDSENLEHIRQSYSFKLPDDYLGRAVAPSDVIELYNDNESKFFYCNKDGFCAISFAPELVK